MRKKTNIKSILPLPKYTCRECVHSYDWHGVNYKGEVFMCLCRISGYARLLSSKQCENFKLKE